MATIYLWGLTLWGSMKKASLGKEVFLEMAPQGLNSNSSFFVQINGLKVFTTDDHVNAQSISKKTSPLIETKLLHLMTLQLPFLPWPLSLSGKLGAQIINFCPDIIGLHVSPAISMQECNTWLEILEVCFLVSTPTHPPQGRKLDYGLFSRSLSFPLSCSKETK